MKQNSYELKFISLSHLPFTLPTIFHHTGAKWYKETTCFQISSQSSGLRLQMHQHYHHTTISCAFELYFFFTAFHFHLDKGKKAQVIHVYKKIQPHHIVILRISRHTNTAFRARAFNALHDCSSGSGKRGKVSASAR